MIIDNPLSRVSWQLRGKPNRQIDHIIPLEYPAYPWATSPIRRWQYELKVQPSGRFLWQMTPTNPTEFVNYQAPTTTPTIPRKKVNRFLAE